MRGSCHKLGKLSTKVESFLGVCMRAGWQKNFGDLKQSEPAGVKLWSGWSGSNLTMLFVNCFCWLTCNTLPSSYFHICAPSFKSIETGISSAVDHYEG